MPLQHSLPLSQLALGAHNYRCVRDIGWDSVHGEGEVLSSLRNSSHQLLSTVLTCQSQSHSPTSQSLGLAVQPTGTCCLRRQAVTSHSCSDYLGSNPSFILSSRVLLCVRRLALSAACSHSSTNHSKYLFRAMTHQALNLLNHLLTRPYEVFKLHS